MANTFSCGELKELVFTADKEKVLDSVKKRNEGDENEALKFIKDTKKEQKNISDKEQMKVKVAPGARIAKIKSPDDLRRIMGYFKESESAKSIMNNKRLTEDQRGLQFRNAFDKWLRENYEGLYFENGMENEVRRARHTFEIFKPSRGLNILNPKAVYRADDNNIPSFRKGFTADPSKRKEASKRSGTKLSKEMREIVDDAYFNKKKYIDRISAVQSFGAKSIVYVPKSHTVKNAISTTNGVSATNEDKIIGKKAVIREGARVKIGDIDYTEHAKAIKKALDRSEVGRKASYTLNGGMLGYDPQRKVVNIGLIGAINMAKAINGNMGLQGNVKPEQVAVIQAMQGERKSFVDRYSKGLSEARRAILREGKMQVDSTTNKKIFTVDAKVYCDYMKEQIYHEKLIWQGVINSVPKSHKEAAIGMARYHLANQEHKYEKVKTGLTTEITEFGGRPIKLNY